jgi:choline dehydrogenase
LLIEAGSYGDSFILNIPIVQPLIVKSNYDWQYKTQSQKYSCKAFKDEKCSWTLGKILGGSHRINNMIYHRGNQSDYEDLIDLEEFEELFSSYESSTPISEGKFHSKVAESFIKAAKFLGFEDFGLTNLTHTNGSRFTHAKKLMNYENVDIVTNAFATRILFSDQNPKNPIGIEYEKFGRLRQAYGNKIVLSAGVIGSPRLLMLSGIGPKDDLEKIGIKNIENLPVGENLQDHISTGLDLIFLNQTSGVSMKEILNPLNLLTDFHSFNGCDAMGFVSLNKSGTSTDLSFMLVPMEVNSDYGAHLRHIANIKDEIWENHFSKDTNSFPITILPILLKPKSRGFLKLQTKDYKVSPIINPNYLSDVEDVKKLISGIRIIQQIINTSEMQKFGAEINPKSFPGCENIIFDSYDYWECYIRHVTLSIYHQSGTCKMGDESDPSTVVLKNFQVKNIPNLYVVDGSILPIPPSANPHATITMFAQKFVKLMTLNSN